MNITSTKLYQLQDNACNAVSRAQTQFYLTGGTALARCYFHHRLSVDLDFFLNGATNFSAQIESSLSSLRTHGSVDVRVRTTDFVSLIFDSELKIDFVNDTAHYWGTTNKLPLFPRVDNPKNILANKITALLAREEPKDVVDIVVIAASLSIDWPEVYTHANSKAVGITPPLVCQKLEAMPISLLETIVWEEDWADFVNNFALKRETCIGQMLRLVSS
ncbi:MAG: hypothetical protein A3A82_00360 [Candidatus Pacebacteria bacterium RIFCSPLOWO2_01_FULL_47_12]|nr:MAG: hypothetical protein A3J60_00665 [Candidatus Pacebacteria bacterium RIFCSPHIGHO2_02_FULL_46_9]OGJ39242.1 MAG: hypothetical protein A3A82_00360 [Candidatus Pacebacteria bacterium RIFCSPLOWO2_01_FULL_47_12]